MPDPPIRWFEKEQPRLSLHPFRFFLENRAAWNWRTQWRAFWHNLISKLFWEPLYGFRHGMGSIFISTRLINIITFCILYTACAFMPSQSLHSKGPHSNSYFSLVTFDIFCPTKQARMGKLFYIDWIQLGWLKGARMSQDRAESGTPVFKGDLWDTVD